MVYKSEYKNKKLITFMFHRRFFTLKNQSQINKFTTE